MFYMDVLKWNFTKAIILFEVISFHSITHMYEVRQYIAN